MIYAAEPSGIIPLPPGAAQEAFDRLPSDCAFAKALVLPADAGMVDLICITDPRTALPLRHLRLSSQPTVILIGDDPGPVWVLGGPTAWRCSSKIGGWCKGAIVHAAGGTAEHYAEAVRGALLVGQLVLVETTSRHAAAWAACVRCPTTLMIMPSDGPHPIDTRVLH